MTDIGSYHLIRSERNKTVLVPQPSDDVHDPLVSDCKTSDRIKLQANQRKRVELMITMVELESVLEDLCNHIYSASRLCTNTWSIGHCTNLPSTYARFPLRLSWCGTVHWNHHTDLRIQQLPMASIDRTDLSQ